MRVNLSKAISDMREKRHQQCLMPFKTSARQQGCTTALPTILGTMYFFFFMFSSFLLSFKDMCAY